MSPRWLVGVESWPRLLLGNGWYIYLYMLKIVAFSTHMHIIYNIKPACLVWFFWRVFQYSQKVPSCWLNVILRGVMLTLLETMFMSVISGSLLPLLTQGSGLEISRQLGSWMKIWASLMYYLSLTDRVREGLSLGSERKTFLLLLPYCNC